MKVILLLELRDTSMKLYDTLLYLNLGKILYFTIISLVKQKIKMNFTTQDNRGKETINRTGLMSIDIKATLDAKHETV